MSTFPAEIDLLIEPRWLIPVEPAGVVLEEHALAVDGGRILDLLPAAEAARRYLPRQHVPLPAHALLPGFVNLHTHAAMTLLRGYAEDLPLSRWLAERIVPAERRLVSPAFVHDGALLACWEMLRGGVTCFSDMYFHPEQTGRAAMAAGIRAALGMTVIEFPTPYAADADDYLAKGLAARDALRDEPLLSFTLAPHAPYTISDRTFERVATLSAQLDLPVHIHVHETAAEVADSVARHGVRPLARLHRLGLLDPHLIAVHAVHLTGDEIELLAEHGCNVAHCPTSNLKLASGIAPLARLLAAGVRVGLGTDGAASNNRLDMMGETRQAALLAKAASGDASIIDSHAVLRLATLEGARALGLGDRLGSLQPGKAADICAVRLDEWHQLPCPDPVSQIVHVAGREQVSHVWVGGRSRIREGLPADDVVTALRRLVYSWHNKMSGQSQLTRASLQ